MLANTANYLRAASRTGGVGGVACLLTGVYADTPARSKISLWQGHTSFLACPWCWHTGEWVTVERAAEQQVRGRQPTISAEEHRGQQSSETAGRKLLKYKGYVEASRICKGKMQGRRLNVFPWQGENDENMIRYFKLDLCQCFLCL